MSRTVRGGGVRRALAAAAVTGLLSGLATAVLTAVVLTPPPAQAMTQTEFASGSPGETVTVAVRNDETAPPSSPWTITAPPGTRIESAAASEPPGAGPFRCTGSGERVMCGFSGAGGWARYNIVTLTLAINADARAGDTSGVSAIEGSESSPYTVTVLAPPAPTLTAPADRSTTLDPAPAISGTKRAGNTVQVLVDGSPACTVPADAATTWTCTPRPALRPGPHTITTTQTSPGGDTSPAAPPISVRVLEPASLATAHSTQTTAVPTATAAYTISTRNNGPGTAENVSLAVDHGSFPARECTVAEVRIDCAGLAAGVPLGDIAPGREVVVRMTGVVPAGTPAGTAYAVTSQVSSRSDAASPVTAAGTMTVTAPAAPPRPPAAAPPPAVPPGPPGPPATRPRPPAPPAQTRPLSPTPAAPEPVPAPFPAPAPLPEPVPPPRPSPPHAAALAQLPMNLRFPGAELATGVVSTMRGSIGPNTTTDTVTVSFDGSVGKGAIYRTVRVTPGGTCEVVTTSFRCTVTLPPGEEAVVEIRLVADALNAPETLRQQFALGGSDVTQASARTVTTAVASADGTSFFLDTTRFPGAFIPVLALLLLSLAAVSFERRRPTTPRSDR